MRWYVNSNGRTTGPVEEADLVEWVKEGLVSRAHVRDESGGTWVELSKSPFARFLPRRGRPTGPEGEARESKAFQPIPSAPSLEVNDLFDHALHLDEPAPKAAAPEAAAPRTAAPKDEAQPIAMGLDADDLFDHPMHIDSVPPGADASPAARLPAQVEPPTPQPPEPQPPAGKPEAALFADDDIEKWDFAGAFDDALKPAVAQASKLSTGEAPIDTLLFDRPSLFGEAAPIDLPVSPTAGPLAESTELEAQAKAEEAEPDAALNDGVEAVHRVPQAVLRKRPGKGALMVAGALILATGGAFWGMREMQHRAQLARERAAAEAQQRQEREQHQAEAKRRQEEYAQRTAEAHTKVSAWATELNAAAAVSDPKLVPAQLERIEAIRSEATALAGSFTQRVPQELSSLVSAATETAAQLQNIQKAKDAKGSAMDWLREIHDATMTTKIGMIPQAIEQVQNIQRKASGLAAELGKQVPIELASVMPAATTALRLLDNSKEVLEAIDASHKDRDRGQELVENRDWLAADQAFQDALAKLDKITVTERISDDPLPPELNVASEQSVVVNLRRRISSAVTRELARMELERKQREKEAELEKKAAAYRARCGSSPTVSPFDGQLFGLQDAIRKAAPSDPGSFVINHCSDPVMTKTDCWRSTCRVDGKIFGSDFRRDFLFSEREGFKQMK